MAKAKRQLKIGMTEDETNDIINESNVHTEPFAITKRTVSESAISKAVEWESLSDGTPLCTITFVGGKVSSLDFYVIKRIS